MGTLGYARQELLNLVRRHKPKSVRHPEINAALKRDGIYLVRNFFSPEICADLRVELDRLLVFYKNQIWKDSLESDRRIFGANQLSEKFDQYFRNSFIREVLSEFEGKQGIQGFTMAARLDYKPGNKGSGNGWHRDAAHYSQTKSIIYLSNATEDNGPFEYVLGSHTPLAFMKGWTKGAFGRDQYRYSAEEVEKYLEKFPNLKAKTFPAEAGSLILADTRGLHRGSPIKAGSRYAATNYFFIGMDPPKHLIDQIVKSQGKLDA